MTRVRCAIKNNEGVSWYLAMKTTFDNLKVSRKNAIQLFRDIWSDCVLFQILEVSEREFFDQMGVFFISFVSQYGYDRVLSVLGRHMRDFLNGLDNLHEYLKFSYPRMRAPSFICENETRQGLTLHYRSKRRGFVYYTMGQIREVTQKVYFRAGKFFVVVLGGTTFLSQRYENWIG